MQAKVTLSLNAELVQQLRSHVRAGRAKSQSEFVEDALRTKLRQMERDEWDRSLEQASKDPLYLADIEQAERDFRHADAEAAKLIR